MALPFETYGWNPGDWHNGANDGHLWELVFRTAPSAEQKHRLAEAYERKLASGPARAGSPFWKWSGRHARFLTGERWNSAERASFAKVREVIAHFHTVAPLSRAIFLGQREPATYDHSLVDADAEVKKALAEDPDFEAKREAARRALRQEAMEAVEEASGLRFAVTALRSDAGLEIPAEVMASFGVSPGATMPPDDGDWVVGLEPFPYAMVREGRRNVGVAYVDGAGDRKAIVGLKDASRPVFAPSGDRALLHCERKRLYELDFETGEAQLVWTADDHIGQVAYLADHWAIKLSASLRIVKLERDDAGAAMGIDVVAEAKCKGLECAALCGGSVIGVMNNIAGSKASTAFFGFSGDKLKKLSTLTKRLRRVDEVDGAVIVRQGSEDYVVSGLNALYAAWLEALPKAKPKAKAQAAKKASARKRLTLLPVSPDAVPPADALRAKASADDVARFRPGSAVFRSVSGRLAAICSKDPSDKFHTIAAWENASGEIVERELSWLDNAVLSADGKVFMASGGGKHLISTDTGHVEALPRETVLSRGSWLPMPVCDGWLVWAHGNGLVSWRWTDGAWKPSAPLKIAGFTQAVVSPSRRVICAISSAKKSLLVYAEREGELKKLAAFEDKISDVRVVGERIFALSKWFGTAFEVVGF